jgi:hypothetical protein
MKSRTSLICTLLKHGYDPARILIRLALRDTLVGCDSALEPGCGVSMTMRYLGAPNTVGFEGYQPSFDEARRLNTHDRLVQGDVRDLARCFQPRQFDACVALDLIEHLNKEEGIKLMQDMEKIARKKVLILTPSGFLPQRRAAADDLQQHLSGWEPAEMARYGYRVMGFLGPKGLRGEHHALNRKPAIVWGLVSLLGHFLWTRWRPEQAAAILSVKTIAN